MADAPRDPDERRADRPAQHGQRARPTGRADGPGGRGQRGPGGAPGRGAERSSARGGPGRTGSGGGRAGGARGGGSYVQELGTVLRQRDPLTLRAFLAASARRFGNEAEAAEIACREPAEMLLIMHQMIVARPDLQPLHADSQRWLRGHGLDPDVTGESRRN